MAFSDFCPKRRRCDSCSMKRKLTLILLTSLVLTFAAMLFAFGVGVGHYEIFPYSLIESVRHSVYLAIRADATEGKALFDNDCARCHGIDGSGGEGPRLDKPALSRAADDDALRSIIRDGIGVMRPVRQTTTAEQNNLIAYVRALGRSAASAPVAGNVEEGRALYDGLGCASCHIVNGVGEGVGPELTHVGAMRGREYLHEALTNPTAALPRGTLEVAEGLSEFLPVRVTTLDGREIRGARINEDTFTIQLRDADNQYYSFRKSDLRALEKGGPTSLMPSWEGRLTDAQMDDLIAYLLSLNGRS